MAKRSWDTANGGEVPAAVGTVSVTSRRFMPICLNSEGLPRQQAHRSLQVSPTLRAPEYEVRDTNHTKQPASLDLSGHQQLAASDTPGAFANGAPSEPPIPQISRKIKACASCRKHKVGMGQSPFIVGSNDAYWSRRSNALWTREDPRVGGARSVTWAAS